MIVIFKASILVMVAMIRHSGPTPWLPSAFSLLNPFPFYMPDTPLSWSCVLIYALLRTLFLEVPIWFTPKPSMFLLKYHVLNDTYSKHQF